MSIPWDVKVEIDFAVDELGLTASANFPFSYTFLPFFPLVFLSTISFHSASNGATFEDGQETQMLWNSFLLGSSLFCCSTFSHFHRLSTLSLWILGFFLLLFPLQAISNSATNSSFVIEVAKLILL